MDTTSRTRFSINQFRALLEKSPSVSIEISIQPELLIKEQMTQGGLRYEPLPTRPENSYSEKETKVSSSLSLISAQSSRSSDTLRHLRARKTNFYTKGMEGLRAGSFHKIV